MFHSTAHVPVRGTMLFVPGDRPERIVKALDSGADAIVVDLEDAVDPAGKDSARELATEALTSTTRASSTPPVFVRINGLDTAWAQADVQVAIGLAERVAGVVVPKAERADELCHLATTLSNAGAAADMLVLLPVVETARGVLAVDEIAGASRVGALLFGPLDLAAELGISPSIDGRELLHARSRLVLAAAAAGLPGPIDGPYPALADAAGLARSSMLARELGFTGKIILHPQQLNTVREEFAPTSEELAHAREVIDAHRRSRAKGAGAAQLPDGSFVDKPVVSRAAAMLGTDPDEDT